MRIITLLILCGLLWHAPAFAGDYPDFKRHNFEITAATGLDYEFVIRKYKDPVTGRIWKVSEKPFAGFCFGFNYTWRPIRIFGLSTGLETMLYGSKPWETEQWNSITGYMVTSIAKGYTFNGLLGVPVYPHFFWQMTRKITVELITGPEFFFNFYNRYNYTINNTGPFTGDPIVINETKYLSSSQIKQSASWAWDIQLLTNVFITKLFSVSAGPEWKFLELRQLQPGNSIDYSVPRTVPFFLGAKVALCFGSNFWKTARAPKD